MQLADLLWGAFLLLGWEQVRIDPGYTAVTPLQFIHYPISHSLLGMAVWAVAVAAVYYSWPTRDTSRHWQAAALVGLAVLSHFLLDVIVHVPDLPLSGDSPVRARPRPVEPSRRRRCCWSWRRFAAGVAVYVALPLARGTRSGPGRLAGLVTVLVAIYLAQLLRPAAAERHGDRGGRHRRPAAARRPSPPGPTAAPLPPSSPPPG